MLYSLHLLGEFSVVVHMSMPTLKAKNKQTNNRGALSFGRGGNSIYSTTILRKSGFALKEKLFSIYSLTF